MQGNRLALRVSILRCKKTCVHTAKRTEFKAHNPRTQQIKIKTTRTKRVRVVKCQLEKPNLLLIKYTLATADNIAIQLCIHYLFILVCVFDIR